MSIPNDASNRPPDDGEQLVSPIPRLVPSIILHLCSQGVDGLFHRFEARNRARARDLLATIVGEAVVRETGEREKGERVLGWRTRRSQPLDDIAIVLQDAECQLRFTRLSEVWSARSSVHMTPELGETLIQRNDEDSTELSKQWAEDLRHAYEAFEISADARLREHYRASRP